MAKSCVNHPEAPAVGTCKVCEKALCLMCATEVHGRTFCSPECAGVYKEVTHWIDRKAAPEEWNPLAEPSSSTQLPDDDTALELEKGSAAAEPSVSGSLPEDESVLDATRMRVGPPPDAGRVDVPILVVPPAEEAPPARRRIPPAVWAVAAASLLVVVGIVFLGGHGDPKKDPPVPAPVAKANPPKPPPPAVVEPPKPEPPKPPPPVVVKPDPTPPPGIDVRTTLDRAAASIREAVPLFTEVVDTLERGGGGVALLEKAERARRGLAEARRLYSDVRAAAPEPAVIETRLRRIDSLLDSAAHCVEQIKSRL